MIGFFECYLELYRKLAFKNKIGHFKKYMGESKALKTQKKSFNQL